MFRPLFLTRPTRGGQDALNAGSPATDEDTCGKRVRDLGGTVARLAGLLGPSGHGEQVAEAFLPDVITYRPGQPAAFRPGDGNGRALGDNALDIAVAVLAGSALGNLHPAARHPGIPLPVRAPASRPDAPHRLLPLSQATSQ